MIDEKKAEVAGHRALSCRIHDDMHVLDEAPIDDDASIRGPKEQAELQDLAIVSCPPSLELNLSG